MDQKTIDNTKNIDIEAVNSRTREHQKVALLYNGMINPVIKYTAKGFIWYQGEANITKWMDYDKLMVSLVNFWRDKWNNKDMPFYYVQLAHYEYNDNKGVFLPLTVEAQYKAMKQIPKSSIAATTDIGHKTCIHPSQKREVGQRLAFMALRNDYGIKGLPLDAPVFKSMKIEDDKIVAQFDNIDNAGNSISMFDKTNTLELTGFEIAGEDKVFYPASAMWIKYTNNVKVASDKVKNPVAVRYGFRNFIECNVKTNMGQPLVPFRTDNW